MKLLKSILAILTVFLIFPSLVFPTALVNVPLDHWSYQLIQRFQAKGILREHLSNSRPYSRGEMAKMLIYISQLEANGSLKLTSVESNLLNEMKKEFAEELKELGHTGIPGRKNLVDWADGDLRLIGQMNL
ncbi:hypothetical protein FJZ33_08105, partial [Candidatus Poribacteria bacterium]|nr:hypothetical protein [Candidatus Poribacteria bacterium]